jgi:mevalonate kinase
MIQKSFVISEADYEKLCDKIEQIHMDASQAFTTENKEQLKDLLGRIFSMSYDLLKELGYVDEAWYDDI